MKNIFKSLSIILLFVVIVSAITACGGDSKRIVGTWNRLNGPGGFTESFTFNSDDTLVYQLLYRDGDPFGTNNGYYSIKDSKINITFKSDSLAEWGGIRGGVYDYQFVSDGQIILFNGNSYEKKQNNDNASNNGSISKSLIGKWEVQKYIYPDREVILPNENTKNSGFHFERNGYTYYRNGSSNRGFQSAYSKGNKIYFSNGIVAEWSIKSEILTAKMSDTEITIAKKVQKFSWE